MFRINYLLRLCSDKVLCDVVLVAEDTQIHAHRTVLAGCSSYFYAMFTKFEERKHDRVALKDIDGLALELLIEYVYTGKIHVTEDNVQVKLLNKEHSVYFLYALT